MLESGITAKGQTTFPKAMREALSAKAGDRVRYLIEDGQVRVRPVRPISRLFGVLKSEGPVVTLQEMEQAIADGARES